ncbi:hypothetical protein PCE1_002710 [Barthelona sp. PCE]
MDELLLSGNASANDILQEMVLSYNRDKDSSDLDVDLYTFTAIAMYEAHGDKRCLEFVLDHDIFEKSLGEWVFVFEKVFLESQWMKDERVQEITHRPEIDGFQSDDVLDQFLSIYFSIEDTTFRKFKKMVFLIASARHSMYIKVDAPDWVSPFFFQYSGIDSNLLYRDGFWHITGLDETLAGKVVCHARAYEEVFILPLCIPITFLNSMNITPTGIVLVDGMYHHTFPTEVTVEYGRLVDIEGITRMLTSLDFCLTFLEIFFLSNSLNYPFLRPRLREGSLNALLHVEKSDILFISRLYSSAPYINVLTDNSSLTLSYLKQIMVPEGIRPENTHILAFFLFTLAHSPDEAFVKSIQFLSSIIDACTRSKLPHSDDLAVWIFRIILNRSFSTDEMKQKQTTALIVCLRNLKVWDSHPNFLRSLLQNPIGLILLSGLAIHPTFHKAQTLPHQKLVLSAMVSHTSSVISQVMHNTVVTSIVDGRFLLDDKIVKVILKSDHLRASTLDVLLDGLYLDCSSTLRLISRITDPVRKLYWQARTYAHSTEDEHTEQLVKLFPSILENCNDLDFDYSMMLLIKDKVKSAMNLGYEEFLSLLLKHTKASPHCLSFDFISAEMHPVVIRTDAYQSQVLRLLKRLDLNDQNHIIIAFFTLFASLVYGVDIVIPTGTPLVEVKDACLLMKRIIVSLILKDPTVLEELSNTAEVRSDIYELITCAWRLLDTTDTPPASPKSPRLDPRYALSSYLLVCVIFSLRLHNQQIINSWSLEPIPLGTWRRCAHPFIQYFGWPGSINKAHHLTGSFIAVIQNNHTYFDRTGQDLDDSELEDHAFALMQELHTIQKQYNRLNVLLSMSTSHLFGIFALISLGTPLSLPKVFDSEDKKVAALYRVALSIQRASFPLYYIRNADISFKDSYGCHLSLHCDYSQKFVPLFSFVIICPQVDYEWFPHLPSFSCVEDGFLEALPLSFRSKFVYYLSSLVDAKTVCRTDVQQYAKALHMDIRSLNLWLYVFQRCDTEESFLVAWHSLIRSWNSGSNNEKLVDTQERALTRLVEFFEILSKNYLFEVVQNLNASRSLDLYIATLVGARIVGLSMPVIDLRKSSSSDDLVVKYGTFIFNLLADCSSIQKSAQSLFKLMVDKISREE